MSRLAAGVSGGAFSPPLHSRRLTRRTPLLTLVFLLLCLFWAGVMPSAWAVQGIDPENRPIAAVEIQGLEGVSETLVRNQIRAQPGEPYRASVVEGDVVRITHLGRFSDVRALVQPRDDGSLVLVYRVQEQPLLRTVRIEGNKKVSQNDLLGQVLLRAGDPADPFLIERARQQIIKEYEDRGYFTADVTADEAALRDRRELILRVREGPRVQVRGIRFEGNTRFSERELKGEIKTRTPLPLLRRGDLNREQIELDAASLRQYYEARGFLDARVGRRIDLAPNQKEAVVTFQIQEGPQYRVGEVRVEGEGLLTQRQVQLNSELVPGGVFSAQRVEATQQELEILYGRLGYLDTRVVVERLFHDEEPLVDVVIRLRPGEPSVVGQVYVSGNEVTKNRVILHQVRGLTPGRPFDREGLEETRRRLRENPLFGDATVAVLGDSGDPTRDVLIEVRERNTGSLGIGAALSSDSGVLGAIDIVQRNFDITDFPESVSDIPSAFRGAGQYFALSLQPGNEFSRYSVSFREPYLLETDYFFDATAFYFTRSREDYDEQRFGGGAGIGRRFGDVWSAALRFRAEDIQIDSVEDDAPLDVFDVEGDSLITTVGLTLTRSTTDSALAPTRGSRISLGIERAGLLGGDYDFTRVGGQYDKFWTIDEDFLGRRSVLSFQLEGGYIIDGDAPVFERYYAGGRTFRGFRFRGVGPRGIRADTLEEGDDPVGGDWLLLTGLQYEFPLAGDYLRGVVFTDQGTLTQDIGFDDWRVSVGAGLRIKIGFLSQAPFAIDFAYPLVQEDTDEKQVLSFDVALPFR